MTPLFQIFKFHPIVFRDVVAEEVFVSYQIIKLMVNLRYITKLPLIVIYRTKQLLLTKEFQYLKNER